ncbi:hypothetical protein [Neobacillus driksii]
MTLNGEKALPFVRMRKGESSSLAVTQDNAK